MATREEILIVDDDEAIRKLLTAIITEEGYSPRAYADGTEALRRVEEFAPIAIFLDAFMPGMSGLQFLNELRKSHPDLPVLILTAFADQNLFRETLQYRIADFISKPFTAETIQTALRKAMGNDESFSDKFLETVTHRLREARIARGLKQSEVAARCGMSTSQVSQIELRQSAPSVTTLLRLCKSLHLSMTKLVEGF